MKTFTEYFNEAYDKTYPKYPYAVMAYGPIASNIFIKDVNSDMYANVYYKYNEPKELASEWKKIS